MKKSIFYLAIFFMMGLTFTSCNEDDDTGGNPTGSILSEMQMLRTTSMIYFSSDADFQTGMEIASINASLRTGAAAAPGDICGTVTSQSTNGGFPKTYTIDYGTGCTDNIGNTRSGTLTVTLTGFLLSNGSQMIVERSNYYINGYKIEGTVTHTNTSQSFFSPTWDVNMPAGQITTPEGDVYTHFGTRSLSGIAGFDSEVLLDNVFSITAGTHTVTDTEDNSTLVATVSESLVKRYNCSYMSDGVINLQGSWLDGNLDFGNDTCDDDAVYTHEPDGQLYPVQL